MGRNSDVDYGLDARMQCHHNHDNISTIENTDVLFSDVFETSFGFMGLLFDAYGKLVFIVLPSTKENVEDVLQTQGQKEIFTIEQKEYFGRDAFLKYFQGDGSAVSELPINLDFFNPSEFQKQVLSSCALIPFGTTITYGELAMLVGTNAYQAIGGALSKNPLPIIIPCHRVIGKTGLGGFTAKEGISLKARLLTLEAPKTI